jgi:hypothetical protein
MCWKDHSAELLLLVTIVRKSLKSCNSVKHWYDWILLEKKIIIEIAGSNWSNFSISSDPQNWPMDRDQFSSDMALCPLSLVPCPTSRHLRSLRSADSDCPRSRTQRNLWLTGAFYAGNFREWSQSSLVIIIPATPSNSSIPYVKRTSKLRKTWRRSHHCFLTEKTSNLGTKGPQVPPSTATLSADCWGLWHWRLHRDCRDLWRQW